MEMPKTKSRGKRALLAAVAAALLMKASMPAAASNNDTIASVISQAPVASTTECHGSGAKADILQCTLLAIQRWPGGTWIAWGLALALFGGLTYRAWQFLLGLFAAGKELDVSGLAKEADDQNEVSIRDKQAGEGR